jgi:serine/threonine protein kinase
VSPTTDHEERFAAAQRLLEQYFEQRAQAGAAALGFESFVSDQAELEAELRELYDACGEVDDGLLRGQQALAAQQAQVREVLEHLRFSNSSQHRYAIESEIGKGGMGAVFRVVDRTMDRPLAMKVILGQVDAARSGKTPPIAPMQLRRFLNEAKITGRLDHPGIVPVHEVGVDAEGRAYFTMKLVKGRDLKTIFDLVFEGKEGWNETRALGVILKVCEAMAYAHSKGVIHRDLKPANVMVGDFGEVYVMDWGVARMREQEDAIQSKPPHADSGQRTEDEEQELQLFTMEGDVIGTPSYMPPEQARGEVRSLGPQSDVYAIGAMLYHLLGRQMPYVLPGTKISNSAVLAKVLNGPPLPLFMLRNNIPRKLIRVVESAMARPPKERYSNMLALSHELRSYLEHPEVKFAEMPAQGRSRIANALWFAGLSSLALIYDLTNHESLLINALLSAAMVVGMILHLRRILPMNMPEIALGRVLISPVVWGTYLSVLGCIFMLWYMWFHDT